MTATQKVRLIPITSALISGLVGPLLVHLLTDEVEQSPPVAAPAGAAPGQADGSALPSGEPPEGSAARARGGAGDPPDADWMAPSSTRDVLRGGAAAGTGATAPRRPPLRCPKCDPASTALARGACTGPDGRRRLL
jgi:hypothetical protein